ncbi:MAG: CPBP family glutamic-type intramembrane protease [bacterium]|nr:CPBP family glutamic-type intramembrane protease [bacterium]
MWDEREQKPVLEYLVWTFLISWCCEGIILAMEHTNVLPEAAQKAIVMIIIGFGAGLAPAYATFILLKRHDKIKEIKEFWGRMRKCTNWSITLLTLAGVMAYQLLKCCLTEEGLGNPWYCFILFLPVMFFGGGLEEVGWRGFLQPALEERMPFVVATLLQGAIWSIWHLPLWLIRNANQSQFQFLSFWLYCTAFSFSLALVYKLSKSVIAVVVLHAWGNVVLGGMFTIHSLTEVPGTKTLILYAIEIVVSTLIVTIWDRRQVQDGKKEEEKILIVNTLKDSNRKNIVEMFPNAEVVNTNTYQIHSCIGCNSCWIKTPGKCAIKDDYEALFKKIVLADKIVFLAEERLGMVSYQMKNIIDRMIAVDVPYTCIKNGQTRHCSRYKKCWKLMLVMPQSSNRAHINDWMERVAINFHSKSLGTYQITEREKINHALYDC